MGIKRTSLQAQAIRFAGMAMGSNWRTSKSSTDLLAASSKIGMQRRQMRRQGIGATSTYMTTTAWALRLAGRLTWYGIMLTHMGMVHIATISRQMQARYKPQISMDGHRLPDQAK